MTPVAPTIPPSPARPSARPDRPVLSESRGRRERRVRLAAKLAAASAARAEAEAAIRAWRLPVDPDVAVLLTSELVSNAITHGVGPVTLVINSNETGLRVTVHDGSANLPVLADVPPEAEAGRGLLLVASLSAEWGSYRTARGKAVYFTLGFPLDVPGTVSTTPSARASR